MKDAPAHIVLTIDVEQPVEVSDFVALFTSLSDQFTQFIASKHPKLSGSSDMYIREVRKGSIEADLIPWALAIISNMDRILIVEEFVRTYASRLKVFFKEGGRLEGASRNDLKDFMGAVSAIARDPNGTSKIKAVAYENGKQEIRASIQFDTREARTAVNEIGEQRRLLEHQSAEEHNRVLMVFSQSNVKDSPLGKRSGERVIIEQLSPKDLPLIYASDLAEEQIKYEIRMADENVFKKGFVVDVNVETKANRAVAYRVVNLHQIIDLPDEAA
ncbi:hypothetical protein [Inquilinus sp. Marseille-Q2685]|uniref:hypothetical protein n=1 Tax=Inquilinus sp. Marseille-Q2685 TaxID=2866581 RepID=UPI001CE4976D|nr:hypothetical protein [Inquilinus sp. Marseille-Q2685]